MIVKDHEISYYQQRYKVAVAQYNRLDNIISKGEFKHKLLGRLRSMINNAYQFKVEMGLTKDEDMLYINAENYDRLESVSSRFNTSITL